MISSYYNTPQMNPTLSAELREVIRERNILTTRTRIKVLSALDNINKASMEERHNSLRSRAIQEILTSEVSYLHQLELIMTFFMHPMKEKSLVNKSTFMSLFGNIETIYRVNGELLRELKQNPENIATAFLKLAPFFKLYSVYAYDYKQILMVLQDTMKVNYELTSFIEGQEGRPEVGTKLMSLLITPIQRIPRYRLLLKEVLSHTPVTHDDYCDLQGSLQEVEKAAEHINRLVQDQENMQKIIEVQRSLYGARPRIVAPGRKLIKEGMLMKVSPRGRKAHPRYFFLFNDMMIYCKMLRPAPSEADSLRCCCILPLKDCLVDEILCKDMFKLTCHDETLILYSATFEEGEKWVKALKEALKQFHECRQTLRKDSSSRRPMRPPEFLHGLSLDDLTSRANRKRKRLRRDLEEVYQCDDNATAAMKTCPSSLRFKAMKIGAENPWKKIKLSFFKSKQADGLSRTLPQSQTLPEEIRDSLYPLRSSVRKSRYNHPPFATSCTGGSEQRIEAGKLNSALDSAGCVGIKPVVCHTNLAFDLIEQQPPIELLGQTNLGYDNTAYETQYMEKKVTNGHPKRDDFLDSETQDRNILDLKKIKLFFSDISRSFCKHILRQNSADTS